MIKLGLCKLLSGLRSQVWLIIILGAALGGFVGLGIFYQRAKSTSSFDPFPILSATFPTCENLFVTASPIWLDSENGLFAAKTKKTPALTQCLGVEKSGFSVAERPGGGLIWTVLVEEHVYIVLYSHASRDNGKFTEFVHLRVPELSKRLHEIGK